MRSDWKTDHKLLLKVIIAYCLGMILGSIIAVVIAICCKSPLLQGVTLFGVILPFFVGSFFASYIAQNRGWLIASILTLVILLVIYLTPVIRAERNYDPTIPLRIEWIAGILFASIFTGILGHHLALWRNRHKNN